MRSNNRIAFLMLAALVAGVLTQDFSTLAQGTQTYKARLSVVPIANARGRAAIDESEDVFATANATATLNGTKLTVTGSFAGFKSPASIAQIHQGAVMGVRGPALFDLTVTKATKGTISGTFDLTPDQVNMLKNSRLYIQIHNENTPEGALWGWFLK